MNAIKINPNFQRNEEFYCEKCNKVPEMHIYGSNFKCIKCKANLQFKIIVENFAHSCSRVKPNELKVGDQIILVNKNIHNIINISKTSEGYQLALKQYGLIEVTGDSILTRIEGGWYY